MLNNPVIPRPIVSREEWLAARRALLAKEKEATRLRDRSTPNGWRCLG